jgi:hypothetical protein
MSETYEERVCVSVLFLFGAVRCCSSAYRVNPREHWRTLTIPNGGKDRYENWAECVSVSMLVLVSVSHWCVFCVTFLSGHSRKFHFVLP